MTQTRGKFLVLIMVLMRSYEDQFKKADTYILEKTGKHWNELDPEGWYDTDLTRELISYYVQGSPTKEKALITFGKQVYPTIKRTTGLPPELKTPLEYIEFEAKGHVENLRGLEVKPRRFLRKEEGCVVIEMPDEGEDCRILEGVYLGILKLADVFSGQVEQKKCVRRGDPVCEFHITW